MKTDVRHSLPLAVGISLSIIYTLVVVLHMLLPDVAANLASGWLGAGLHMPEVHIMGWVKGVINTFVLSYVIVALTQFVDAFLHKK